jgi:hypothetical protein
MFHPTQIFVQQILSCLKLFAVLRSSEEEEKKSLLQPYVPDL